MRDLRPFVVSIALVWACVAALVLAAVFAGAWSVPQRAPSVRASQVMLTPRTIKILLRPFAQESRP